MTQRTDHKNELIILCTNCNAELFRVQGYSEKHENRSLCLEHYTELMEQAWRYRELDR
jgi:hypothetical protein